MAVYWEALFLNCTSLVSRCCYLLPPSSCSKLWDDAEDKNKFVKYTNSLSFLELDEKINNTLMFMH